MTSTVRDSSNSGNEEDPPNPSLLVLCTIMCALCIAIFCVALDNTIIATAIPHIAREFNSLDQIGWYGSSKLTNETARCYQEN